MKDKQFLLVGAAVILSILFGMSGIGHKSNSKNQEVYAMMDTSHAILEQSVVSTSKQPVQITKLYREDKLIGVVHDMDKLKAMFDVVYQEEYASTFPDSKLGFKEDLIQTQEQSYNQYSNIDDQIFEYLKKEDLFAIETNKLEFSNGAVIYVKNVDDFNAARETFIKNFLDDKTYQALLNEKPIPSLVNYGKRDIAFEVAESIKFSKALASKDNIFVDEGQIIQFLNYGYNPKITEVKVKAGDTIPGVAYLNGMSTEQLIAINRDVLESPNQLITEGMVLKVSHLEKSPFTVTVTSERLTSEPIYPQDIIYENDPTLREGVRKEVVKEKNGSRDVYYEEVVRNGEMISSKETKSHVTQEPVRGKVLVGTKVEPKVGSGNFRWPMNNAYVMCGYGCYSGHRGVDFAARNGKYGPIYAIDRGVVTQNAYGSGWGYYIKINHGNGYESLYAHMASPGYFGVGQTVAKGDNIGYVGMTGRTTAPHVHLEVYRGGAKINACSLLGC